MSLIFWKKNSDAYQHTVVTESTPLPVRAHKGDGEEEIQDVKVVQSYLPPSTPAGVFGHISKTTNAASAVQLGASMPTRSVLVTAKDANTGYVYIGEMGVSSTNYGKRLTAGQNVSIAVANLNLIYIDVSVNGEGVDVLYVR